MSDWPSAIRRYALRIVLLLMLVLVAGWAGWDFLEARRANRLLTAARAAGEPLTRMELRRSRPTVSYEAARLYLAAGDLVRVDDWDKYRTIQDRLEALAATWPPRNPVQTDLAAANRLLEENRLTLEMLDAATPLEFVGFPPGTESNYRSAQLESVDRVAALRAAVLALGSDPDAAVSSLVSWLRMSRVFRLEAMAWRIGLRTAQLQSMSSAVLERFPPSAAALERVEQALRGCEDEDELVRSALMERAWLIEIYWPRLLWAAPPRSLAIASAAEGPSLTALVVRPVLRHQLNAFLSLFADIISAARTKPGLHQLTALKKVTAADRKASFFAGTPRETLEFYQADASRALERLAMVRCARVAVAVERFRLTHHTMPTSLAQVAPDAAVPLPRDPMTGESLKFSANPNGYVVYSVGDDGRDDGGQIDRPTAKPHAAAGMQKRPALDWGIRIRSREVLANPHRESGMVGRQP